MITVIEVYTADLIQALSAMTEPVVMFVRDGKVRLKVDGLDIFFLDNAAIWHTVIEYIPDPKPPKPEPEPYVEF